MVTIQLTGSEAHAHKLNYYLLGRPKVKKRTRQEIELFGEEDVKKEDLEQGQINFLNEIRKKEQAEAMETSDEAVMDELSPENEAPSSKKQKKEKVGMYDFFQQMRKVGVSLPPEKE